MARWVGEGGYGKKEEEVDQRTQGWGVLLMMLMMMTMLVLIKLMILC